MSIQPNPDILYKYRDWTNPQHKSVLTKGELYLASPADFNDPFDCRIAVNFHLLNTDKKIMNYVNFVTEKHRQSQASMGVNVDDEKERLFTAIKFFPERMQLHMEEQYFPEQDRRYGIISLSELWDSILMWGHYAHNHTGFNIGFKWSKLKDSPLFSVVGPVIYEDKFPQINPIDNSSADSNIEMVFTKATDWSYEKEYRLFKMYYPHLPNSKDRVIALDKSFIAEINLGVKFPPDSLFEIQKIAKKLNVPLYQTKMVPFKFELDRTRIN
ncbi:MAG: DUF2971 domain-containing protein [Reichenbachiella sp.]|uniref:DUF2971 domain-containing protein n=1 Tax=Reichenbachiella sp. TaxID=2184521 RepID=UPI003267E5BE